MDEQLYPDEWTGRLFQGNELSNTIAERKSETDPEKRSGARLTAAAGARGALAVGRGSSRGVAFR